MKFTPQPVSDLDLAFPARGVELAPPMEDIPEEFRRRTHALAEFQSDWFMFGLDYTYIGLLPAQDIDPQVAWNNLEVIQGCFGLKHQRKEAAVAFLASEWFDWIAWLPNHEDVAKIRTWVREPWTSTKFERPSDFTQAWVEHQKEHRAQEPEEPTELEEAPQEKGGADQAPSSPRGEHEPD